MSNEEDMFILLQFISLKYFLSMPIIKIDIT